MKINFGKDATRITPEDSDDLWVLSQIIEAGDTAQATTLRKVRIGDGDQRNSKVQRKPMKLLIKIEKVEFSADVLRLLGTILQGPSDVSLGDYHTISVEPGTGFTLGKQEWPGYMVKRLKEACSAQKPKVLIVVFDREEATFALATATGYKIFTRLKSNLPKKGDVAHESSDFYKEIATLIKEQVTAQKVSSLIVASPAFWKEYLLEHLGGSPKPIPAQVNATGEAGVNEVLKRPEVKEALSHARVASQMRHVEELLAGLARGSPVAYGVEDCAAAAQAGAIKHLLVSEVTLFKIRQEGQAQRWDGIMRDADRTGGQVSFVGDHEAGKKLEGLGGMAATLRYPMV